jgi:hypothetical protein
MPSAARRALIGSVAAATLLSAAACGGVDSANAAGVTHDDLVSELVTQLTASATLSYAATYRLAGGDEARITQAQSPTRVAYSYPGGRLLRTPAATIRCQGPENAPACTKATPDPADGRTAGALTTPDTVLALLNVAALDPDVTVRQHDTTIAGHHATCLTLTGVSGTPTPDFSTCVTAEGALGSFAATGNGRQVDQALVAYFDKPDLSAFRLPAAAKVVERRK